MRLVHAIACAIGLALLVPVVHPVSAQMDPDKVIPGGGVFVQGWTGKIDSQSVSQGRKLEDAKFAQEGANFHITTGPAVTYWNPANTASGDYTIKATFTEPHYMNLMSHPHSYGIVIGGNDMGTDQASYVYCVAYGDGRALVRGFNPTAPRGVFTLLAPTANAAVHKAAAKDQPVTQDIMWTVKGGRAECSINGTVVAGYDKADLVAAGKLKSTDGVYGLRFTHNVEAIVAGFGKS
jgi:hypothetical protein